MHDETHDTSSLPYFSPEHELLRAQIRRFVETEIKPYAQAWEDQGFVPREVCGAWANWIFRHSVPAVEVGVDAIRDALLVPLRR